MERECKEGGPRVHTNYNVAIGFQQWHYQGYDIKPQQKTVTLYFAF